MNGIKGLAIMGETNPETSPERLGVIPFKVEGMPNGKVASILSTEYGIGVRNGCFCAHPYVVQLLGMPRAEIERFRNEVRSGNRSHMPGVVRISFGMYNTEPEVDRLCDALADITGGNYIGKYTQEKSTGDYYAEGWEPDLSRFFGL
jgi:selenocysteine lyase/cysteine desulfurase